MRDAADVGTVLMYRLPMLWLNAATPTASVKRETQRMIREKNEAMLDGMVAASMECWRIGMSAWLTPIAPETAMRRISAAATSPARKTLRANAKRLKARKTR